MSSFNRTFARFYYNMLTEIQPLEGAAKLHYASISPPESSLLLLERSSVTLQHMFIDSLEVEDNLRLSKKFPDLDSNNNIEKELELKEQYEPKELSLSSNSILCKQEDDQINDVQEEYCNGLFYESFHHPVINFVSDNSKEVLSLPI